MGVRIWRKKLGVGAGCLLTMGGGSLKPRSTALITS